VTDTSIDQHLEDLRRADPVHFGLVQRVREIVREEVPDVSESVMYGGIMFAAPIPFCGVFSYAKHVSIEFSRGCDLADAHGVLEGSGKLRRHIKVELLEEIEEKHVREYVAQAYDKLLPG
jgi:hypothetical protein